MKQTEAQLRASKKYHEKLENIQLRVPKGEKGNIAEHAKARGESTNAFIYRAVKETIARNEQK